MLTLTLTQWLAAIAVAIFLVVLDWHISGEAFSRVSRGATPMVPRRSHGAALANPVEALLGRKIDSNKGTNEGILHYAVSSPLAAVEERKAAEADTDGAEKAFKNVA